MNYLLYLPLGYLPHSVLDTSAGYWQLFAFTAFCSADEQPPLLCLG